MKRLVLVLSIAATAAWAIPSAAQDLGRFHDWGAHYFTEEDGNRVCSMWTQPKKAEGKYSRRGEIFALVTHRPADKRVGIVSFEMGYPFASGKKLAVVVDGSAPIRVTTEGEQAWGVSKEVNRRLVKAMQSGLEMVATGRSRRGTRTVDTYSLRGFTAAYKAISKACGVG